MPVDLQSQSLAGTDPEVLRHSWSRCQQEYGLCPDKRAHETVVLREAVPQSIDRLGAIFPLCQSQAQALFKKLNSSHLAVILSDHQGVIVDFAMGDSYETAFRQAGLRRGADWREIYEGTNGIGTALKARRPVTVCQQQHYLKTHAALTCSGAPIFSPQGDIAAVLDVSQLGQGDAARRTHIHNMVATSAGLVSRNLFLSAYASHLLLAIHPDGSRLGSLQEGVIAISGDGIILACDAQACHLFRHTGPQTLVGAHFEQVFAMRLDYFQQKMSEHLSPLPPMQPLIYQGQNYMARVIQPLSSEIGIRGQRPAPSLDKGDRRSLSALPFHKKALNEARLFSLSDLVGQDQILQDKIEKAHRLNHHDVPIVFGGETGVGKSVMAAALHRMGPRASGPFIEINCGAFPESLLEGELYGYLPGAFTGARKGGYQGRLQQAHKGTLFLDEIGDMPLSAQTRLLHVLESRTVTPLGGEKPIHLDIQVMCGTHHSLADLCQKGAFRSDLYFRLCGFQIMLPALRDRRDLAHIIQIIYPNLILDDPRCFAPCAVTALIGYHWPGNMRELRTILKMAQILAEGRPIQQADLIFSTLGQTPDQTPDQTPGQTIVERREILNHTPFVNQLSAAERISRADLVAALTQHHWQITKTAAFLKLSRHTIYRKMKAYKITKPS